MIYTVKRVDRSLNFGVKDQKKSGIKLKYDGCHDNWIPGLSAKKRTLNIPTFSAADLKVFKAELGLAKADLEHNSDYWLTYSIIIPGDGLTLDTNIAADLLKYQLLIADPYVVQGRDGIKTNAKAEYVITSEQGKAKSSNSKRNTIAKAYAYYDKMSTDDIINALFMFGKDGSNLDPEIARDRIGEIVEENPAKFLKIIGDPFYKDKVWMMKLISEGVVRKNGRGSGVNQPLFYEDVPLGTGLEAAIAYLKDDANQNIYLALKNEVE